MEVSLEQVSVAGAIESTRQVMQGVAQARSIDISVQTPPPDLQVWMDATKIKQILFNLLSNAVKLSPDDSTVELTARMLDASGSSLGMDSLELRVCDHGPGIAEKDLPHIFEEFWQLGSTSGSVDAGTGLGLTLTQRLVELQGGSITVSSVIGAGTTFEIVLPTGSPDGCHVQPSGYSRARRKTC